MDLIADTSYLVGLWRGQTWATKWRKPLVSRNRRHFGLVEGLHVEALQD
jgi:hypothetical protein